MNEPAAQDASTKPQLGLWDAVSIIVGIVVGVSIFKVSGQVFRHADGAWMAMGVWGLGGLFSFVGALCYAELATTYPRSGGDYVYLSRAYGSWVGFLFGWAQLAVILTGSIGVMAFAFAIYATRAFPIDKLWQPWLAIAAVVLLTVMNLFGVALGKTVQNFLTGVKILGLGAIIVAGIVVGFAVTGTEATTTAAVAMKPSFGIGVALVMVMYAFGGWNDAAFVAAEVKDQRRNLPLALMLGTLGITLIYLLVNLGYLWGMGYSGVRESDAPAASLFATSMFAEQSGGWGERSISILVMISAVGAVNGLIFTGSRVYSTMGADHRVFAGLARWNPRTGSPVTSLVVQGVIAVLLILVVGTSHGQGMVDKALGWIGLAALPWQGGKFDDGFDLLFSGTAPVFWTFFLLTGLSVFVLRFKDRGIERPFSVPLYPIVPLVFCLFCVFMLYMSLTWAEGLAIIGIVPLLIGLPLYVVSRLSQRRAATASALPETNA